MIQSQIVEYAIAQLKGGVSKDAVRSALIAAGWPIADVDDSLKAADAPKSASPPGATKPKDLPGGPSIKISELGGGLKFQPTSAKTISIGKKPEEPGAGKEKGMVVKKSKMPIVLVLLAVIAIGGVSAATYLYITNRNLAISTVAQLDAVNTQVSGLTAQVDALTKTKNDLTTKVASLSSINEILASKLSFFVAPPNATSSVAFTLQGILSGNANGYIVTSNDGIRVTIKNTKDAKVSAALAGLVGANIMIAGTHAPGSKEVIVNAVNGMPVVVPSSATTASP